MTKEEYKVFKAKYELFGRLEEERRIRDFSEPNYLTNFIVFLDEIHRLRLDRHENPDIFESKLQGKISMRRLLSKFPKGTFERI